MSLKEEIEKKSSEINSDSYQMSIGELINLYKDGEMDIHPEFQRVFRWTEYQKTKLIESIMLNIPIPPIFVSQSEDGTWDVIDGVQRLSTIFQFVGCLKDDDGKTVKPLELIGTDSLPSFDKMKWSGEEEDLLKYSKEQQLTLKRARLDVTIIKKESDYNAKYELFQRLNTGGSLLSDQEVRSCLIIMSNKSMFELISNLSKFESFTNCVKITDRKTDEQYALEMVVRLLVANSMDWDRLSSYEELSELLDKEMLILCQDESIDYEIIERNFKKTFDYLYDTIGEDVFRRYENDRHKGPFLATAYQAIASGLYGNIEVVNSDDKDWLIEKIRSLYKEKTYKDNTVAGVRAIPRFKDLTVWGNEYFKK